MAFPAGLPLTVSELATEIKSQCKVTDSFRLNIMDTLFGSEFMNLTSMNEIEYKATVKVIFTPCRPQDADDEGVGSFSFPPTSTPDDTTSFSSDSTIILTSPESTSSRSSWPDTFQVPSFSYDAEFKLENAWDAA